MTQTICDKARTTRRLYKRVPLSGGGTGFTTVADGEEELFYKAEIDVGLLHQLARKAAGNTSCCSKDGALTVKVVERRRILPCL